jgi:hypothetical protein
MAKITETHANAVTLSWLTDAGFAELLNIAEGRDAF